MERIRNAAKLRRLAAAPLALGLVFGVATTAAAGDDERVTDAQYEQVKKALEAKGYGDVRDVEIDDGRFEADAVTRDGAKVDLELDMQTLEVLHEKRD
ncbi:MAG: peptidase [Proteobacteria bacterium]|nr:MAG: peptidase [Pseudomonadota bacterium]